MSDLKSRIGSVLFAAAPGSVWMPADFATLGGRDAVDKASQDPDAGGRTAPD